MQNSELMSLSGGGFYVAIGCPHCGMQNPDWEHVCAACKREISGPVEAKVAKFENQIFFSRHLFNENIPRLYVPSRVKTKLQENVCLCVTLRDCRYVRQLHICKMNERRPSARSGPFAFNQFSRSPPSQNSMKRACSPVGRF